VLATHGWHINTACIERMNLSIRQHVAAVGRWVPTRCKQEVGLYQQLVVFQTYHNFCMPHASWRQPLQFPSPPRAVVPPRCGDPAHQRWPRG
jgi:hypothetical protein